MKYPEIVEEIKKELYVDDWIGGGTTIAKAKAMKEAAIEIFADASFELHKGHSNLPELETGDVESCTEDQTFAKQQLCQGGGKSAILGLEWDKQRDTISVAVPTEKADATKREILANIARLYDPLGVASPLTLSGKLLYRDACNFKVGWDEQLPPNLGESSLLESITIPMCLAKHKQPVDSVALHVFGDASGVGVAAAAFTVVSQPSRVTQGIVAAKARLAKQGLTYCGSPLDYIRGNGEYKQFVNNRVQKKEWIKWRYVPTKENPADLGSRGGQINQENSLWWYGPVWLFNPSAWPADVARTSTPESLNEAKTIKEVFKLASEEKVNALNSILNKFSLWRVLRISARIARFLHNSRSPNQQRKTGPLTTEELREQRRFWERRAQQEGRESKNFQQDRLQLNLQQNDQLLLECRGRIHGSYPVYLPDTSMYSEKFVQEAHEATSHGGVGLMTKVRERHWIPRLRRLVKRVVKKCPGCKRFQAVALAAPPPGLLSQDRTEGSYPFEVVGVDFAGPIEFKTSTKRESKAYIILYACSLTRALHLDLARSMETAEFLLSLKGLMARRGRPSTIYSDNGSTFIGAAAWIRQVKKDERLNDFLAHHQIVWKFNLSRAPWWGGQFERMKKHP
ncbi:uncharacterized protein LOC122961023 [Acropora millepora]|uniref:uncharacterized protein LOC122961023 n=1 Tax=Acropora millepora TaxID=45264 RepID=UPI001CF102ED|nr:uncharacterized protein LOC122961023 [Acropora millepora]